MLITKDLIITFKNDIGSVDISLFSEYTLTGFEEDLQNSITTTKQNLIHGTTYISNTLNERYITISGVIECNKHSEDLRLKLIRMFNPNLKGKLILQKSNNYYKTIDVYVENGLDPEVVSLVTALNKIEGIETITSCSGHGIDCLQIDLYCDTFDAIKFLIDILPNDMVIMQPTIPSRANSITLKLSATNHNVNIGHDQADNFAKIIMEKLRCK